MRDEIVTLIIFILLVTLFVYNSVAIDGRCERLISSIEKAEDKIGEEDEEEYFRQVSDKWSKEKKALFYISGHNIIMQIDENILMGCDYIKLGDRSRALYNLKKAKVLLEDLCEREKIRLDNIF